MSDKPEALRLAEILEGGSNQFNAEAAAELRRLHALCKEWEMKAANWLASPEAAKRLEGYRSLGAKCAELEAEVEALRQANEAFSQRQEWWNDRMCALEAEREALRADALRYRWLRDHPSWSVSYRIRPGKSKEWRMRDDEGDLWGNWWPTHEQAVDHWIKEQTK